jgi:hypothetical protein
MAMVPDVSNDRDDFIFSGKQSKKKVLTCQFRDSGGLVAGHSQRRPGFNLGYFIVILVVENVVLGQVSLRVFQISHVSIISLMLLTHSNTDRIRTGGRSLGTITQAIFFWTSRHTGQKTALPLFHFSLKG